MLMALFLIGIGVAMAQTQVQGTIVDEQGEPVIGASVLVKGTTTGTVTNIDGEFALSAPANGMLVISYVGMQNDGSCCQSSYSSNPEIGCRIVGRGCRHRLRHV